MKNKFIKYFIQIFSAFLILVAISGAVIITVKTLDASANAIIIYISAGSVVLSAVFASISHVTVKRSEKALLSELKKAMEHIASGDYSVRLNEDIPLSNEFNAMAESIEKLHSEQWEFFSDIAHDLKSPMTSISGFVDGMLDGAIPPEKHSHCLNIVSTEIKRLSRLATGISRLAKFEHNTKKPDLAVFDVAETARNILISFEQRINEKSLNVEFDTESDKMLAYADQDAIYEVIYNIIDNAVKFSKSSGKLSVSIKDSGEKLTVSIYNEGDGIKDTDIPNIFNRFYRTDKSVRSDRTGSGIGMHIVRSILDAHGESVTAESEYGKSCCFKFTLAKANIAKG